MNNKIIILIACFVTNIVVSIFIAILMALLFKRIVHNNGLNNNNIYNAEQIKELFTKYCVSDAIITKRMLEHPSTATVIPKWLTELYVDNVKNDGEFPHKKKLYDLLDCMTDYVASWTRCDDAHSAQQMKDILPLLVRCKVILKIKGE